MACEFIRWLGVEYEIRGTENINVKNGGVVLLNHQSAIDIVCEFFKPQSFQSIKILHLSSTIPLASRLP